MTEPVRRSRKAEDRARSQSTPLAIAAAALVALAACGAKRPPPPPNNGSADPPVAAEPDTRPPIERRRAAACGQLGPRLAQCAVEDSRAMLAAGKITRAQFEEATKPEIVRGLAADWRKKCRDGYMSSRQVRVLEVCFREETACAPLEACLENLKADTK